MVMKKNSLRVLHAITFTITTLAHSIISRRISLCASMSSSADMSGLRSFESSLRFDNRNLRDLPIENQPGVKASRQVPNAIFSIVNPTKVEKPKLIAYSQDALNLLGIKCSTNEAEETFQNSLGQYFSGNDILPGSRPAAHCYCGHQFGGFAGQLGDGATMYLGEVMNSNEDRWELQLKGAGKTPFSRTADGRKVLRSSVREFLCSEAMHFLGIPTTRAATCVTSDSYVERDPMYDGGVIRERCTIISRIAPNFFRFGSFEIFKEAIQTGERSGPSAGNEELKEKLLDHMLTYYPHIAKGPAAYASFFREVVEKTAKLAALWQSVGFVHGVLNTDNMSIMGLTIDYGPFGFLEQFDSDFVPNGSDGSARYSYKRQPEMCQWNLQKFAEALQPLLLEEESEQILRDVYQQTYDDIYNSLFREKLGFLDKRPEDPSMFEDLFTTMENTNADFTDVFVAITDFVENFTNAQSIESKPAIVDELVDKLTSRCAPPASVLAALKRKGRIHKLQMHPNQIAQLWDMLQGNPAEVSRMFSGAPIEAIRNEVEEQKKILDMLITASKQIQELEDLSRPAKQTHDRKLWRSWCDKYVGRLADDIKATEEDGASIVRRITSMRQRNPTFVLRNWILQDAIAQAEKGDFGGVQTLVDMLREPCNPVYSTFNNEESKGEEEKTKAPLSMRRYLTTPPEWADSLICTCSS